MMNELIINGTQEFMGFKIPVIEGGFGNNQKCVLVKTVAEIHNIEVKKVNELINNNIDEFESGIDIIDLCNDNFKVVAKDLGLITSNGQKFCYLLSEQGYMALSSLMRTDKAKEIRKQFRREYFTMREVILSDEQLKANLLLSIYNGGQEGVMASKRLAEIEVKIATTPLLETIEEQKPMVEFANHVTESVDTIDIGELAKIVKNENIDIGRNRLFEYLRKNKILMSNNIPYQTYMTKRWFEVIETTKQTAYGSKVFSKVLVTGKGQVGIVEMLRKDFECK